MNEVMNPKHPRWAEFFEKLELEVLDSLCDCSIAKP